MSKKEETHNYKGWLNSDSFIKRVFAIMGYSTIGQIFLTLLFLGIMILFGGIGLISGGWFTS